ncbi:conserved protein of unknown function [Tenacibaculum sp. 190130A14a]|uniref:Lipoprotein n=1 Tax=Tenacibaculum polynesiense TaxID=3137857 RepID=A0ABM9P853_9FLAO
MKFKYLYYFLCILLLNSCNKKNNGNISCRLFDTENLNQEIKSVYDLKNQGFNPIKGNISLLEKKNRDTIVHLQIDHKFNDLRCKIWLIKLNSIKIEEISTFLLKYNLHMTSSRCYDYDKKSTCQFSVFNPKNNKVYICEAYHIDKTPTLKVIYFVPR